MLRVAACVTATLLAFAALALQPKQRFRFAILGDRTGGANQAVYEQVWRSIDASRPDFVINVGDTIEGGNDRSAEAEWSALSPLLNRRYPLFFVPGNHDIWSDHSRKMYERYSKRPAQYSFDFENAHFTVLDNSQTEQWTMEQLEFLDRDLEQHSARHPKFVFFHKPFWLLPLKFENLKYPFHRIVRKHKVDLVVSGHVHQFARLEREGVIYLMIGSSGGRLRGKEFRDGWFYHHTIASVRDGAIQVTGHETGLPFGQGRSFDAKQWVESGPLFDPAKQAAR